ncbi:hypothetical protein [Teredinibacter sp. KSP-S5-2]|uniref:hypothetical protein n=1 Tax=Teredinibacter sp. KSP-S5-2 TaxID=3034506 RepID=UPI0029346038|nr:hypothetical protein [Teredinibacter sp. KSP-S5-2]WNO09990.1 hypothetical protein P5V12_02275 [Teredinibacter sp. KSP-S5-2]
MEFIVNLVFALGAVYIVYSYYFFAFKGKVPQSPAALGRAFAAPTLIWALVLFIISFIQKWAVSPFFSFLSVYEALSTIAAVILSVASGWVASRTSENTQAMNLKILSTIGLVPFSIVTWVGFMSGPTMVVWLLIFAYIPMQYIGYRAYKKYS